MLVGMRLTVVLFELVGQKQSSTAAADERVAAVKIKLTLAECAVSKNKLVEPSSTE